MTLGPLHGVMGGLPIMGMKGESKQKVLRRTEAITLTDLLCRTMFFLSRIPATWRGKAARGNLEFGLTGHPGLGRTQTGVDPGGNPGVMVGSKPPGNRMEQTGMADKGDSELLLTLWTRPGPQMEA